MALAKTQKKISIKYDLISKLKRIFDKINKSEDKFRITLLNMVDDKMDKSLKGFILVQLLFNILYPDYLSLKAPIAIDKETYNLLIYRIKNGIQLNDEEYGMLQNAMFINLCHCIKKLKGQNKFKEIYAQKKPEFDEKEVCYNSIYLSRGFEYPKNIEDTCKDNFVWF